ncbi:concanavalin A-like lectin/glucanase domain-containing protein [Crucibulum laeve]|uniref:Concanavalin A-like lectin/glucanase domain-containing protein n=1 Tax=Crucibulum laeve TaxID=68775 RepID=A0A5C3LJF4_9AGAR|nr:concanavalin A-like lectin/glucanase domain-containing protein [Crucibulum laeve]
MKHWCWSLLSTLLLSLYSVSAVFLPLHQYEGQTFFDTWDFYGNVDNTTWGNVTFLDRADAKSKQLVYINDAGNAVIKLDTTADIAQAPVVHRDSIRLTSRDTYGMGSLIIIDALHIPYGCSVWPSFWTLGMGKTWPGAGEIDIIEAINLMDHNQIALHTTPGCVQAPTARQSGATRNEDCSTDQGCIVAEVKPNSFGAGFSQAGGGVYALQIDATGIYVWFFSRPDVPASLSAANKDTPIDTTVWGLPTAAYPSTTCDFDTYFGQQQLILLTTLCGIWAGEPHNYAQTCPGNCVADYAFGPGSPRFDNAFWEIKYVRAYIEEGRTPPPPAPPAPDLPVTTTSTTMEATSTSAQQAAASASSSSSSAPKKISLVGWEYIAGLVALGSLLSVHLMTL